ncbi:MAG: branched-chain amino acid ABC transporter substrate-binding protein [Candidatus Competibacter sp.]|nr:branched-chain amino acid ABC transporter substrate-binding protein [Candidatus Competibacter sp.]MDG4585560.1 branched-chain amino acid ABC transporter substrate-binding protein [Candidatus Competibacter sp.]
MDHPSFPRCLLAVALAGGLSLSGLAGAADTIKIGVAGPMTGGYAAFGEQFWRGASQAAEDINAAGGINGKQIELVKGDDACEPKQATAVANRLLDQDKVAAVVGHFCSSSTIPASEVYADAGVLVITPGSTNPKVTERGLVTVFRMCGRDDQQGPLAADFIVKELKAKKIAVVHDKDTYGQGIADAMRDRLKELKADNRVVLYEGLTRGEKDFNALVTKIKASGADTVYFGGLYNEAGPLLRQLREQGLKVNFLSGDGSLDPAIVTAAGGPQFVEGAYMTSVREARNIPASQAVVKKMKDAGFDPSGFTLYAYASLQAIADSMKGAKTSDGAKLAKWLKSHTVPTVLGPKSWDGKGDLKDTSFSLFVWEPDGTYKEMRK